MINLSSKTRPGVVDCTRVRVRGSRSRPSLKSTAPFARNCVEGPDEFSGSHVECADVPWGRAITLVGGRANDQLVLEDPARRRGLHQSEGSRIAVETVSQIHRAVRAEGPNRLARTGIDSAKRLIRAKKKTPVRAVPALPVI